MTIGDSTDVFFLGQGFHIIGLNSNHGNPPEKNPPCEQDLEARKASIMAMLSHELKSPLHGITGLSSSLLDDTEVPLSVKKPLSMMQNCAKRLLDMVSDLEQNCWIFVFLFGSFPMGKSPKQKAF